MGYFSNLSIDNYTPHPDWSYPSAKEQLLWRYEDLQARYEELTTHGPSRRSGQIIDDIEHTLPEHLNSLSDVATALELAAETLSKKYNTYVIALAPPKKKEMSTQWLSR